MNNLFYLAGEAEKTQGGSPGWIMIVYIVLIVAFFYFFMIRPQKKQEKETANMRNSLEIGDEVTTIGGIIGRVTHIKDDVVTIESGADKNRLRIKRSAIATIDLKNGDVKAPKGGYKVTGVKKGEKADGEKAEDEKEAKKSKKAKKLDDEAPKLKD